MSKPNPLKGLNVGAKNFFILGVLLITFLLPVFILGDWSGNQNTGNTLVITLLIFLAGSMIFAAGFNRMRKKGLIKNTPTSKIGSLAMGTVEVKGEARKAYNLVKSPIDQEKCLFYKYKVEEHVRRGKNSYWETIDSGINPGKILLDDGTGTVVVDLEKADLDLSTDVEIKTNDSWIVEKFKRLIHRDGDERDELQEKAKEFVSRNNRIKDQGSHGSNARRFKEWYVKPGEQLYVFGKAMKEKDENGEYTIISRDESTPMFKISDASSEEELTEKMDHSYRIQLIIGGLSSLIGYLGLLGITGLL